MAMPRVTLEDVIQAATNLAAEGVHPSVATVREALGGRGSFTTITKHLQIWREQSKEAVVSVELPESVEAAYRQAAASAWSEAVRIAQEDVEQVREQAATREAELLQECSESTAEVERLESISQKVEEKARQQAEELKEALAALEGTRNQLHEVEKKLAKEEALTQQMREHLEDQKDEVKRLVESIASIGDRERESKK